MKKILLSFLSIAFFILSACAPANIDLSGVGGLGETPEGEASIAESTEEVSAGQTVSTVSFYAPSLTISTSESGVSTTGVSIAPIGRGEYQLSAPKELEMGREGTIKLILVPPTVPVEKKEKFKIFEEDLLQVFQGQVDIYPNMKAEILMGNAFSISSSSDISQVQLINTNDTTTWLWFVTAQQAGKHSLAVDISVPVLANGKEADFSLTQVNFEIQVVAPPPTATTIPSPVPTATKSPSIGEKLTGSAADIAIAVIKGFFSILAIITPIYLGSRQLIKKRTKRQAEEKKKALEKSAEELKKNLPGKKNSKGKD